MNEMDLTEDCYLGRKLQMLSAQISDCSGSVSLLERERP